MSQWQVGIIIAVLLSSGCSEKFHGSAGAEPPQPTPSPPSEAAAPPPAPPPVISPVIAQTTNGCTETGQPILLAMVIDASNSTNSTDPSNVRRTAALRLADKLQQLAERFPNNNINAAVITFNRTPVRGSHGWLLAHKENIEAIRQDISAGTAATQGGTYYLPALEMALAALREKGAQSGAGAPLSYMLFMSDGRMNGPADKPGSVVALTGQLVNLGVAIYAVGAGSGLKPKDEKTLQAMALPTAGSGPNPNAPHTGLYKRVTNSVELDDAWNTVFAKIAECK